MLFTQLENFCVVVEHGSIGSAAKSLNMTQPAVSKQVRALEDHFGVELFVRTNRGVSPTEAGSELYSHAQKILQGVKRADQAMASFHQDSVTAVNIGATTTIGTYCLPCSIVLYHRRSARTRINSTVANTESIVTRVNSGEFNLALIEGFVELAGDFTTELIYNDELVGVGSRKLEWSKKLEICDLPSVPLIVREKGSGIRSTFEKHVEEMGLTMHELNVAAELSSMEAIKSAVMEGYGVAFLPYTAVKKEVRRRSLSTLDLDIEMLIPYSVVWNQEALTPEEEAFLHFLLSPDRGFCTDSPVVSGYEQLSRAFPGSDW